MFSVAGYMIYSGAKHPLEVSDTANEFPGWIYVYIYV